MKTYKEKMQEAAKYITNQIAGLCKRYSVDLKDTNLSPEDLSVLIGHNVPNFEIKRLINEIFEDTQRETYKQNKELFKQLNNIEILRLIKKYS